MLNYNQVLAADKYYIEEPGRSRLRLIASALRTLLLTYFCFPPLGTYKILFFRSLERPDYETLLHSIASTLPSQHYVLVENYLRPGKRISPMGIILLLRLLPLFFSFSASSLATRVYLYLRLCFYYRALRAVEKYEFNTLVLFADMQPVENLLAQHYNKRGVPTVTLQHGLYVDYGKFPTVNVINYLNQPSKYFLSWGQETKNLIKRYHPDREIFICGKPKIESTNLTPAADRTHQAYFTVILDQNIFERHNKDMIHLLGQYAAETGLLMNVRFHPRNIRRKYRSTSTPFHETLDIKGSSFVVGHTSSLMYELLALGIPSFKYKSDIPCVEFPDQLIFATAAELREVLTTQHDYASLGKRYIEFTDEESLEKYKDFFDTLLNTPAQSMNQ